jgi:RimJ/RimL family protein N-acetyltransferase
MNSVFETQRLFVRQFTTADAPFIIELLNTPGWLKFISDRNVHTIEAAELYILNVPINSYKTFGFGLYLVITKNDLKPIGMCGLIKRDALEHPDIGFAFLPGYNGKGYAFVAAQATLKYAREKLGLPCIQAITLESNSSSINLLQKIGLHFDKKINMPPDNEELLLYTTAPTKDKHEQR